jgi:glycosyltransferase involved in cell wall biosynthesis
MLAPDFSDSLFHSSPCESNYFVWTTNSAPHKNHENALKALKWYYDELDGQLDCLVTGVNTDNLLKTPMPHLLVAASLANGSKTLRQRVRWHGELPDIDYKRTLVGAAFLWHAGKIDNGTFSVVEAASLRVPALSSDYPAMREIDEQFALNLAWMDADDSIGMAEQLKQMELTYQSRRGSLPSKATLAEQCVDKLAGEYWKAVRECL